MTNKKDILDKLKSLKSQFSVYGVKELGLYGSYLRDEQTSDSDIDILIDFEPDKESFDNYMAVYDIIESLFKNNRIEIVTKNGLSPYIGPKILNEVRYV